MIAVIIAGGSGTRLWPLSTPSFPKHLLKIDGEQFSLLQRTYERAKLLTNTIYIATGTSHLQHMQDQLPDVPDSAFIVEPARRGPAYCIAAALAIINQQHDSSEPIAFIHADHYIRDTAGFSYTLKAASEISARHKRIVLVGIEPTYAATGFGYIQKGAYIDDPVRAFNIGGFKEKPDRLTAQSYLASGDYLWNAGFYVGSVQTFLQTMRTYAPDYYADYEKLVTTPPDQYTAIYTGFEDNDIDYVLSEKADNLLVTPASFDWMDVGSFKDIDSIVDKDKHYNHLSGNVEIEDVSNAFIQNLEHKPVAVIGLDDIVVINTRDGILVTRKDASQKVGEVSKRFASS